MPTYAFVVAALLSFCALLNAQTITPSNTTTYTYTSTAERVVLALYSPQNYYALVDPLTPAALSVLPVSLAYPYPSISTPMSVPSLMDETECHKYPRWKKRSASTGWSRHNDWAESQHRRLHQL